MLPLDKYRLLVQLFLLVIDFCNLVLLSSAISLTAFLSFVSNILNFNTVFVRFGIFILLPLSCCCSSNTALTLTVATL